MVLPRYCPGWLEEETMGLLRKRLVAQLREVDSHQRLKIYYPPITSVLITKLSTCIAS